MKKYIARHMEKGYEFEITAEEYTLMKDGKIYQVWIEEE